MQKLPSMVMTCRHCGETGEYNNRIKWGKVFDACFPNYKIEKTLKPYTPASKKKNPKSKLVYYGTFECVKHQE